MIRVAIIGCGKIADQHVQAIARIPDATLVGLCDREVLMAGQLAERSGRVPAFGDVSAMLAGVKPEAVHITTPPQGHFALARECLEAGSHVYLEKPFTITAAEAEALVALAERKSRVLTAGHNLQFTLEMLAMRDAVREGFLGGKPVHLESHFSYSLDDATYVGPILGDPNHWVRRLPGQLLHNVVSHGIAKLAEFLDDDLAVVSAHGAQSPKLKAMGGAEVLDELRVHLRDGSGTTAYFCFSTQLRPGQNRLRIFGPQNALTVDHATGSLIRHESRGDKSYLTYLLPPLREGRQHLRAAWRNFRALAGRRLYQDAGMKELVERFYQSASTGLPPPIPTREIILTARIMDEIFRQVYGPRAQSASMTTP
ncbi:MAG TPA: Gfo/Idh/MocA family oxidoreductase [Candidatus Didemnitutus sp.]|nr:Gfo/Idh/MocA family oxidoreductase [Candidatus Didemnitutus sp.]